MIRPLTNSWRRILCIGILVSTGFAAALIWIHSAPIRNIRIAVAKNYSIILINGNGTSEKTIFLSDDKTSYYEPFIITESLVGATKGYAEGKYSLVYFDLATGKTTEELTDLTSECLQYSPSGNRRAYFSRSKEALIVEDSKNEIFRLGDILNDCSVTNQMGWVSEESLIAEFYSRKEEINVIMKIDFPSKKMTEICRDNFLANASLGEFFKSNTGIHRCLQNPDVAKIFGSAEWPVSNLLHSTNNTDYYFYKRWKVIGGGFLPTIRREWIEGYDRKKHRSFYVKTYLSYWEDFWNKFVK